MIFGLALLHNDLLNVKPYAVGFMGDLYIEFKAV